MSDKPTTRAGYGAHFVSLIQSTTLYLATKLGDYLDDLVVVGGLVPTLLVPPLSLPEGVDAHVGTVDLDLGFHLAILDEERYRALTDQLRRAGFAPDTNAKGKLTRQRWQIQGAEKITVDFLIPPPVEKEAQAGKLQPIEADFAALIIPGLELAFRDRRKVTITGTTLFGEKATREIWVCGPGAYIVLKALAFRNRGENKDAYDLYYLVRNYGSGVADVVAHLRPLLDSERAQQALQILREDFSEPDGVGPMRVSMFLESDRNEEILADVSGFIINLLELI